MANRAITNGLPAMHPGELLREDVMPALGADAQLAKSVNGLNASENTPAACPRKVS